ncbi:MAG: hypothetical protein JW719_06435 [Pirellulales bacterium]|nr:hypothetical protein [Pirellulales bacterium]
MLNGSRKHDRLLISAALGVLPALLLAAVAVAGDPPDKENPPAADRAGWLLKLPLPITSDSDRLVKRFVARAMEDARKNGAQPVLIFQFEVPPGQENHGRGSQFGASLELAQYLSGDALAGATTVAYLPRSIQGHAVLVAMACDEIIMAPDAAIGSAGIDSQPVDDVMRAAYRDIAGRRRTVPTELALGMLDPARKVLEVQIEVGREFVTPEGLEELGKRHTVANPQVVIPEGEAGQFTGARARQLGFVSYLADNVRDVARAVELPPEKIEESVLLAENWKAIRVDLEGLVTAEKIERVQRLIEDAIQRDSANFICLRIDSAGGSPTDSANLANFLASLPTDKVRTVAYIPEAARGDAALAALACDQVVMSPDALLGGSGDYVMSAEEIGLVKDGIRERARQKSSSWSLPAAMFDPSLDVYRCTRPDSTLTEYFCDDELVEQPDAAKWLKGQPVTTPGRLFQANGSTAVDNHLANATVEDFEAFKQLFGLENDPTLVEPGWADSLIRILATPAVAMVLLMVGGAALYAELHTPGVGLGGFLALVCFVMFFWAQFIGENAAWLEVLLFLLGLGCLGIEVFVLPGFGVFGIGGGALVLASLVLATQTFFLPQNEYQLHQFRVSLTIVAGAGLGVVLLAALLNRWLPRAPVLNRLMLAPLSGEEKQFLTRSESLVHFEELLGRQGTTTTPLTPSGKARFGDRLVDVIADGEWIAPGSRIKVVEIHGNRVMVEPAADQ